MGDIEKLDNDVIGDRLEDFPEWSQSGDTLQRTFVFDDFNEAMSFVNRVARLAEAQQHHPDILIRYNKVTLTLTTHDAGGVTKRDFTLAGSLNGVAVA